MAIRSILDLTKIGENPAFVVAAAFPDVLKRYFGTKPWPRHGAESEELFEVSSGVKVCMSSSMTTISPAILSI